MEINAKKGKHQTKLGKTRCDRLRRHWSAGGGAFFLSTPAASDSKRLDGRGAIFQRAPHRPSLSPLAFHFLCVPLRSTSASNRFAATRLCLVAFPN